VKAICYDAFEGPLRVEAVPDPTPPPDGVVIEVQATGLCRSDWHGWMGHDPSITLPHVPGHELAGIVASVGRDVRQWTVGDRVTLPFVCGCGQCPPCAAGHPQVCDDQFQPGFTGWGSFAEYVAIRYADRNLVRLPDTIDAVTAASLGCRFATAFRAIAAQGQVSGGQWVAVHGCGGVGLSAVMIAEAFGARVVAIDISDEALQLAEHVGAEVTINAASVEDVAGLVKDCTSGGAHVSLDALGSAETCFNSVAGLRKHGIHVQVGLMVEDERHAAVPMDAVIANELHLVGAHGMAAHRYPGMLRMIESGALAPRALVSQTIPLSAVTEALPQMGHAPAPGVTVVTSF